MHAGIFAAGEGSRLRERYPGLIKPMVPVAGVPLIEWTVRQLKLAGYDRLTILFNSKGAPAVEHLKNIFPALEISFILKDTASSWESFRLLSRDLSRKSEWFLLSTVDSLYQPGAIAGFSRVAADNGAGAVLGVTDNIEDEKPLWADINSEGRITALGTAAVSRRFATCGLYLLNRKLFKDVPGAARFGALREYLGELVRKGVRVWSSGMPCAVDVDDPRDIAIAEDFVRKRLVGLEETI